MSWKYYWRGLLLGIDRFFEDYSIKKMIHLRQIFQMGVKLEERGIEFYSSLGNRATNTDAKAICQKLTEDKLRHKRAIEGIVNRWEPLPLDDQAEAFFEREARRNGIYLDPPRPYATARRMLRYAVDQERKMAKFYLRFGKVYPDEWKRNKLRILAMKEKKHEDQLRDFYKQFIDL